MTYIASSCQRCLHGQQGESRGRGDSSGTVHLFCPNPKLQLEPQRGVGLNQTP